MKEDVSREGDNQIDTLKRLFQVEFIAQAFFELVSPHDHFSPLHVLNHHNRFLSLSNRDHYLVLLPEKSPSSFPEAEEHLTHIQNRKKTLVVLQASSNPAEEGLNTISLEQITEQAVCNGIPSKNLF